MAVAEAAAALRAGEADRAVAVGHDTPIEPQMSSITISSGFSAPTGCGPLTPGAAVACWAKARRRSFSRWKPPRRLATQGASASFSAAAAPPRPGLLESARTATDSRGDRAGTRRRRDAPFRGRDDRGARQRHPAVGCVGGARHPPSVRGTAPPVTAFKWAFGHPLGASGILDSVLALMALRHGVVSGVATLRERDPDLGDLPCPHGPRPPAVMWRSS